MGSAEASLGEIMREDMGQDVLGGGCAISWWEGD